MSVQSLISEYQALKIRLGRQPTSKDDRGLASRACRNPHLKTWNALVRAAEDVPLRNRNRFEFLRQYLAVKQQIGRIPTAQEYPDLENAARRNPSLGSWNALVSLAGDDPLVPTKDLAWDKNHLLDLLAASYTLTGDWPRTSHRLAAWDPESIAPGITLPNHRIYQKHFGSLEAARTLAAKRL